jgi:hypothetical protein
MFVFAGPAFRSDNKLTKEEAAARAETPERIATLPAGVRQVFDYWKANLKPGGFSFSAASSIVRTVNRVISDCSLVGRRAVSTSLDD